VVVPVGGGGLISGIATAVKLLRPDVMVIGVEPEGAADARESLESGRIVIWDRIETVADGLRTSRIGDLNFATIREAVDRIITVSEEEILETVGILVKEAKLVAEPSGAVAPAAVIFGRTGVQRLRTVAVVSGGNIEPERLHACLDLAPGRISTPAPA
jgi:threonine dehydratase